MTTINYETAGSSLPSTLRSHRLGFAPSRLLSAAVATVLLWQQRLADRRRLREMNEHMLRDIGLGREESAREAAKPFWMA